jgi:DNA polymerase III subunit epsilon
LPVIITLNPVFSQLLKQIKVSPQRCGVYFFWDSKHQPLYIGKSLNIKQRLLSHYYGIKQSIKETRLFSQTQFITWQETSGELGALLLEAKLVKTHLPLFNRQLRRQKHLNTLVVNFSTAYHSVNIQAFNKTNEKNIKQFGLFTTYFKAQQNLREIIKKYKLCEYVETGFSTNTRSCFSYQLEKCQGACANIISPNKHNLILAQALDHLSFSTWPFKGKIAIKETCKISGIASYHIIDQWHYKTTTNSLNKKILSTINRQDIFDHDYYLILMRFLSFSEIIELG